MRYFEIYVPGRNGYSLYVKTDKQLSFPSPDLSIGAVMIDHHPDETTIVEMAHAAGHIDQGDAEIVRYVMEFSEQGLLDDGIKLEDTRAI